MARVWGCSKKAVRSPGCRSRKRCGTSRSIGCPSSSSRAYPNRRSISRFTRIIFPPRSIITMPLGADSTAARKRTSARLRALMSTTEASTKSPSSVSMGFKPISTGIGLNPIETEEGLFVLTSVVDISARKRAEVRFRAAVESAPNGMVMIDRGGKIILVNREIERLFGYAREELLGQPIERLVPHRLRERHPGLRTAFFEHPQTRAMGAGRDLYGVPKDGVESLWKSG